MKIRIAFLMLLCNTAFGWTNVPAPDGWPWTNMPVTVQQNGSRFRIDPSFDLRTHAGIVVNRAYYVDSVSGSDNNTGLNWAQSFKTFHNAFVQPDVDQINLATNSYFYKNQGVYGAWVSRNLEIIGHGPNVRITSNFANILTNWTNACNHWETSLSAEYVQKIFDATNPDAWGYPGELTRVNSIAECDFLTNSFFRNYPIAIYVHPWDGRRPDSALGFYEAQALGPVRDGVTTYLRNVTVDLWTTPENTTTNGGNKFYSENCNFSGFYTLGVDELIGIGNTYRRHELNYKQGNGRITRAIEVDCLSLRNIGDATTQSSTAHDGAYVLTVNGIYHGSSGQCIADASGSYRWALGTVVGNSSLSGVSFYTEWRMWLDGCASIQNPVNIENTLGAKTYIRNFSGGGTNRIIGKLLTY